MLSGLACADTSNSFAALGLDVNSKNSLSRTVREHAVTKCQSRGNGAAGCQRRGSVESDRAELPSISDLFQGVGVCAPCIPESGRKRITRESIHARMQKAVHQQEVACQRGRPPVQAGDKQQPPAHANTMQRACMREGQPTDILGPQQVCMTRNGFAACVPMYANMRAYARLVSVHATLLIFSHVLLLHQVAGNVSKRITGAKAKRQQVPQVLMLLRLSTGLP